MNSQLLKSPTLFRPGGAIADFLEREFCVVDFVLICAGHRRDRGPYFGFACRGWGTPTYGESASSYGLALMSARSLIQMFYVARNGAQGEVCSCLPIYRAASEPSANTSSVAVTADCP